MAKKAATVEFKLGDLVKHRSKFLQSVGWYTNVPKDGKVVEVLDSPNTSMHGWPRVQWCDREDAALVHPANIMLAKKPDYSGL